MLTLIKAITATLLVIIISACSSSSSHVGSAMTCEEPRQTMCARDYHPVCGVTQKGTMRTYGNHCTACAEPSVAYFIAQACDKDPVHRLRPGRPIDGD